MKNIKVKVLVESRAESKAKSKVEAQIQKKERQILKKKTKKISPEKLEEGDILKAINQFYQNNETKS